jgi:hypothetical protein
VRENVMQKLTKEEIETLIVLIEIDLEMIKFVKGFIKTKSPHEIKLLEILEKLK